MVTKYEELQPQQIEFIENQHLFFVGSVGEEGFVNASRTAYEFWAHGDWYGSI